MLSVSGCLLNGSVGELSRWRRMMDLSMMFPEGSITGSVISVSIRGSVITVTYTVKIRVKNTVETITKYINNQQHSSDDPDVMQRK